MRTSRPGLGHTAGMKTTVMNPVKAFTRIALGLAIAAMGIYVANADDKPGAAVIGMMLMVAGVVLGVRAARNRLPKWAARTALAVGVIVAAFAAFMTHGVVVTAPLFPQLQEVPSVVDSAPSPPHAAAVERARELVRAALLEQNLPGCPWRSVPATPSSGPKGSDGGTSRRGRPSRRTRDSTSARLRPPRTRIRPHWRCESGTRSRNRRDDHGRKVAPKSSLETPASYRSD